MVLSPPTQAWYQNPSPSTTASSSPDLSQLEPERGSSETTIFTIYSMYGDEGIKPIGDAGNAVSAKAVVAAVVPTGRKRNSYGNSSSPQSSRSTHSDIGGNESSSESPASSRYISVGEMPARSSVVTNGSVHLSYLDDRPPSAYASSSGIRGTVRLSSDTLRSSKVKDLPSRPNSTALRTSSYTTDTVREMHPRQLTPTYSRPTSTVPPSVSFNADSSIPSFRPLRTPPPRMRTPELLSPPKISLASPPRLPSINSPASKVSLVPSDGEDGDAFHVRNTYAELEMTGVKGDGYEDGVERTRARASGSRASELREAAALDDGTEKTRELSPKEIQTLASLDR